MSKGESTRADDRVSLHPLGFEEALKGLMGTPPASQERAAALDAMTHSIPKVREILDRHGEGFVTHEELMQRVRAARA